MTRRTVIILMFMASLFFALNGVFIKNVEAVSPVGIGLLRLIFAGIPFWLWCLMNGKARKEFSAGMTDWKAFALMGFFMALLLITTAIGYTMTYVANAQSLNSISMFFMIILGPLVLGERVSKRDIGFMLVTFAGVVLVAGLDKLHLDPRFFQGDMISLLASLVAALYSVSVRKTNVVRPFYVVMAWVFGLGVFWGLGIALALGLEVFVGALKVWDVVNVLAVAFFGTFLAHTILNISLKKMRAEKVMTIVVLSSPMAYLFGGVVRGEWLSSWNLLGLLLVLVGVIGIIRSYGAERV